MTVPHPEFDGIDRSPLGYEFRIFPPAQPHSLNPGSLVFVNLRSDKNSGLAVIQPAQQPVGETSTAAAEVEAHPSQQQAPAEPSQQCTSKDQRGTADTIQAPTKKEAASGKHSKEFEKRIHVEYAEGGTAHSRISRVTPVYSGHKCVIVCSDTQSFRKLCRTQVHAGDVCIDIGSSYGASTQILWEQCGRAVGLEVSKEASQAAQQRYPKVTFERMDVLAEPQRLTARVSELLEEARNSTSATTPAPDSQTNTSSPESAAAIATEPFTAPIAALSTHPPAEDSHLVADSTAQPSSTKPSGDSLAAGLDHVVVCSAQDCSGASRKRSGQLKVFLDIGGNRELQAVTAVLPALQHLGVPWIFVKSQALIKSALQHLRSLDAHATGTLIPAVGPPRSVLPMQKCEQGASAANAAGLDCTAAAAVSCACEVDTAKQAQEEHAEADKEVPGGSRKRLKRKLLPEKVMWRFSNHNMPRAWDLDAASQTCKSGGGHPSVAQAVDHHESSATREGLAVMCKCSEWWHKLVHQEKPRKYPLDYPARHTTAGVNICRFHNYSTCLKRLSGDCPFDHGHCHACGAADHIATTCDAPGPCK